MQLTAQQAAWDTSQEILQTSGNQQITMEICHSVKIAIPLPGVHFMHFLLFNWHQTFITRVSRRDTF